MEQTSILVNQVSEKQVLCLMCKYFIKGDENDIKFQLGYITRKANEDNIPMTVLEEYFLRNEQKHVKAMSNIETTPFKGADKIKAINDALCHPITELLWLLTEEQLNRLFYRYYTIYEDKVYRLYR